MNQLICIERKIFDNLDEHRKQRGEMPRFFVKPIGQITTKECLGAQSSSCSFNTLVIKIQ